MTQLMPATVAACDAWIEALHKCISREQAGYLDIMDDIDRLLDHRNALTMTLPGPPPG